MQHHVEYNSHNLEHCLAHENREARPSVQQLTIRVNVLQGNSNWAWQNSTEGSGVKYVQDGGIEDDQPGCDDHPIHNLIFLQATYQHRAAARRGGG